MLMGVRKEAKRPLVPLEIGTKKQKLKKKLNTADSCNGSFICGMSFALHKSQVHCSGVMQS